MFDDAPNEHQLGSYINKAPEWNERCYIYMLLLITFAYLQLLLILDII